MTDPSSTPAWTEAADRLLQRCFPLCRSLSGEGLRRTLAILQESAPFDLHEVPSGTPCYDWSIPDEWNVRDAFVAEAGGRRVIDFRANNVHLVSYSVPFEGRLSFEELAPHLHSLPHLPEAIPYRTSYYNRTWGFCLSHNALQQLDRNASYHVVVDADLAPGSLTIGSRTLQGNSGQEYLISTYACHPSLANDNLSGVVLWTLLLGELQARKLEHTYHFVIAPETIGALAWLSRNEATAKKLCGGYVITCVGGPGQIGYKHTFLHDHLIDRVTALTFREIGLQALDYPFDALGSDERQYASPGFRIPTGTISKDKYYEYDYYHTSLDDLDFVRPQAIAATLKLYLRAIEKLEQNRTYRSLNPHGEPMLGKRGLYPQVGGAIRQKAAGALEPGAEEEDIHYSSELDVIRWLMFHADGQTSTLEIAEKTGIPMRQLYEVAQKLVAGGLLEEIPWK